ncbi:orotate phosphoribosyltransferase [Candidatus Nitrosarchaeum limnium]|jgi:orotate phosphoribosyltransferase|uniref:Orotate phosphoribosyltransferase n=2 Tax=Candidatus Nitrosarchaeum limnium TaxID=1007084 RepID=S2E5J6_9ARCH|nr:orotate phosphoribosyltransferase [Candidatus Nitrosarchaeum limnium]EGG41945.1 orotate phosphoribosyltransferase [Candidatus Nitrosarchaeum limnium SFB1]EPA04771.1 orotate phosphoribosyltransferase [Candidatus Nitrosarchaeum limnium BG20]
MEFVKEFSTFLYQKGVIKFGDFTLASGKKSSYYVDLRLVPSYPHQFRSMIKHLQNNIIDNTGLDRFDSLVSVPTGGLIIASALAIETVKPLIYVRSKPKDYGTSKSVEGQITKGMKVVMIDDVATTGGSVVNAIKSLRESDIVIEDAYVIVNRMEGAEETLKELGVKMYSLVNIIQITQALHEQKLVSDDILEKVRKQIEK